MIVLPAFLFYPRRFSFSPDPLEGSLFLVDFEYFSRILILFIEDQQQGLLKLIFLPVMLH